MSLIWVVIICFVATRSKLGVSCSYQQPNNIDSIQHQAENVQWERNLIIEYPFVISFNEEHLVGSHRKHFELLETTMFRIEFFLLKSHLIEVGTMILTVLML
jgi:hypothetical protein